MVVEKISREAFRELFVKCCEDDINIDEVYDEYMRRLDLHNFLNGAEEDHWSSLHIPVIISKK